MPERRPQVGHSLCLVYGELTWVLPEEAFEIGREERDIRWTFQVEVQPRRAGVTNQCALATLPRAEHQHGGERPQQLAEVRFGGARHIFHNLYF